jgi:hypothetical protein
MRGLLSTPCVLAIATPKPQPSSAKPSLSDRIGLDSLQMGLLTTAAGLVYLYNLRCVFVLYFLPNQDFIHSHLQFLGNLCCFTTDP